MKKDNKYLFLLAGIIIGVLGVWLLIYSNPSLVRSPMGMMAVRNNSAQNSATIDAHFIEQMIPHHEDAITMSELALTKAIRPEVKELAENIISAQSKEIKEMKAWYKEWFGKEVPEDTTVMSQHGMMGSTSSPRAGGGMHMGMMGGDTDIESLENAEDFDREFVTQMIPHHQMAVMMANMLKNSTQREEMKQLAEDIIKSQTSEINLMRSWLSDLE